MLEMESNAFRFQDLSFVNNLHFGYDLETSKVIFAADELLELFQLSREVLSIDALKEKIYPEDWSVISSHCEKVTSSDYRGSLKFRVVLDTHIKWIRVTPFLTENESGKLLLASIDDVTSEVIHEDTVTKYTNKKNSMLHMIGHELAGQLNIAKSIVDLVGKETTTEGILKKTQYVASIMQESINLISNLVTREFLETTEIVLFKKRLNIVKKLEDYLEEYRLSSTIKRTFDFSASSPHIYLDVDDAKFMQIMNNLMSNSLKFTNDGAQIRVHLTEEDSVVRFQFSDNGIGISKKMLPHIFDKFTSATRPGLHGEPTVGLGLSIVKEIVGWHKGKIWCESEEMKGTTFWIELPKFTEEKPVAG